MVDAEHPTRSCLADGRSGNSEVASADHRHAAEMVRHGYAAYTPPLAGQPPIPQPSNANGARTQRQSRGWVQQGPEVVPQSDTMAADRSAPDHTSNPVRSHSEAEKLSSNLCVRFEAYMTSLLFVFCIFI